MTLLTSLLNPSSDSGLPRATIFAASDFPTLAAAEIGTPQYVVINPAGVIDNDPSKTNTGQFFPNATVMFWNGTNYTVVPGSGGDVVGPSSAVNNNLAVFDETSGKLIKGSSINIAAVITSLTEGANITLTPIPGGFEISALGGGSIPGGTTNSLQLNDGAGGFSGYSDFTYDPGTKSLTVFNLNSQGQWTLNESGVRAFFLQTIGGKLKFSSNDNNGVYNFDNALYSTVGGFVTGGYGNVILNNDGLTINADQQGNAKIDIYDEALISWFDHNSHHITIGPENSSSGILKFGGATGFLFEGNSMSITGIANVALPANNRVQIIESTSNKLGALPDGAAGQVLTTNGSGVVSWQTPAPSPTFTPETPSGVINGINVTFTITNTPLLALFLNGAYQTSGVDYTITGTTITFTTAPVAGVLTAIIIN
jgi:hypothetical protein